MVLSESVKPDGEEYDTALFRWTEGTFCRNKKVDSVGVDPSILSPRGEVPREGEPGQYRVWGSSTTRTGHTSHRPTEDPSSYHPT